MPGSNNSPIFLCGKDQSELAVLRLALEGEGFRLCARDSDNGVPKLEDHPLSVLSCGSGTQIGSWLEYVKRGGALILCNPDYYTCSQLGLEACEGIADGGILSFSLFANEDQAHIQLIGTIRKYNKVRGSVVGVFRDPECGPRTFPGIVEDSVGRGKILIILFPLSSLITFFHQRTRELAIEAAGKSAEKIALSGVNKELLTRPQLDILLAFLTRFIVEELSRHDKPVPRFGYFPCGYRSLITFSFDDFCPSGRPVKMAILSVAASLKATASIREYWLGICRSVQKFIKEAIGYPKNYQNHIRRLTDLFRKYNATGSAYILPFVGPIKNKVALTGYKGFSKRSYLALKEADWDVGTHIKPMALSDYDRSQRKFERHFGLPPAGHRGHQLGWVEWDKDWERLEELGYIYDSTWNWGGYKGLTWILGTGFPFHPLHLNGKASDILEIPVVAWIKDIYKTPQKSLKEIDEMLDRYPGVFNFAGHSWKITERAYSDFIEKILSTAQRKQTVGLGFNLQKLSEFWKCRELSTLGSLYWNKERRRVSFVARSFCLSYDLSIYIPYYWQKRKIKSIRINNINVSFNVQEFYAVLYATIVVQKGYNRVAVEYS